MEMDKMIKFSGYNISTQTISTQTQNSYPSRESLRVLSAAVVSNRFRQTLLSDPRRAIAAGYAGETFHLDEGEMAWMSSIRAESLAEYARQMTEVPFPANAQVACL
jgi:hypothetical protein